MNCIWGLGSVSEDDDEAQCPRPAGPCPRTFGLRDVDEAAEDLAHARLQGEVLGAAGHRNDKVGRFQVPVLRQQLIEGLRIGVTGQADILRGKGKVSGSAPVLPTPAPVGGARRLGQQLRRVPTGHGRKAAGWGRGEGCHRQAIPPSWRTREFILKAVGHL